MRKALLIALAVGGISLTTGCSSRMNSDRTNAIGISGQASMEQVTSAIQSAAAETSWKLTIIRPGVAEATREWSEGKHNMTVEITYDTKKYAIKYKDSKNLGYDGQTIHRTYEQNVQRLDEAIKARVWRL